MHRVHDDRLRDSAVLEEDLEAFALLSLHDAGFAVITREIHPFLYGRLCGEDDALALLVLGKVSCRADLSFFAHALLELVPCSSAKTANACYHVKIPQ